MATIPDYLEDLPSLHGLVFGTYMNVMLRNIYVQRVTHSLSFVGFQIISQY